MIYKTTTKKEIWIVKRFKGPFAVLAISILSIMIYVCTGGDEGGTIGTGENPRITVDAKIRVKVDFL